MAQNGVIIYMSCTRDVPLLLRSLVLLFMHFRQASDYPIVVFHDDITPEAIADLRAKLRDALGRETPNVAFEYLEFAFPAGFVFDPAKVNPKAPLSEFRLGYRHMCRFHSGEIYKDPRLAKYDWYWRLDSDSYILGPIQTDPFEHMARNGLEYAYLSDVDYEAPRVAEGLWETTQRFRQTCGFDSSNIDRHLRFGKWPYTLFYTNFEIGKFSFFRGPQYMAYYDALDATGMFYYNRWGDAPVHWLGVRMFMPDAKVWRVKTIAYQHNNWVKNLQVVNDDILRKTLEWVDGDPSQGRQERILTKWKKHKNRRVLRAVAELLPEPVRRVLPI